MLTVVFHMVCAVAVYELASDTDYQTNRLFQFLLFSSVACANLQQPLKAA